MKKVLDILSKLGCLFLSIVLFFVLCIYLCLDLIPKIITKDNVKIIVNEVNIEGLINSADESLLDNLYQIAEENNMDKDIINEVISSDEFKEIFVNYYGEIVDAILYDGKTTQITSDSIMNAIDKSLDSAANNLGYTLTIDQKQIIMQQLEENINQIVDQIPTSEQLINEMGTENVKAIRDLFGNTTKIVLIAIMIIIVLIMALIRWSIYRFAIWSGVTTTLVGLIFIVLGSFFSDVFINANTETLSVVIQNLIENNILKIVTNLGTTTLVIGIAQIAYYFIIRKSSTNVKV